MNKYKKIILITVLFLSVLLMEKTIYAEGLETPASPATTSNNIVMPPKADNLPEINIDSFIGTAIKVIFSIGQIAFIIVLLAGGVMYITSAGSEEKASKSQKLITYAVIGIVVLFSAWALASYLTQSLLK